MDLLTIVRLLRRHLALSASIIALTVLGGIVLLLVVPRQYESQSSVVLANPPPPPTVEQIAENPELGQINYNNPYLRFTNDSTVGQVLSDRVNSEVVRQDLVDAGADSRYSVSPSTAFGSSGQVLNLTATGTSPAEADRTMDLVSQRMQQELAGMQRIFGADDEALITALAVAEPSAATAVASGTVRTLVGVAAVGLITLFIALSLVERREPAVREASRRRGRRRHDRTGVDSIHLDNLRDGVPYAAVGEPASVLTTRPATSVGLPTA